MKGAKAMDKDVQYKALENAFVLDESILEWIEEVLNGKPVSEFALSFPIVRRVYDVKKERDDLELAANPPVLKAEKRGD
jgi:hypothetical protein